MPGTFFGVMHLSKTALVLFAFGVLGLCLTTAHSYSYVMDDALITLRYSENLATTGHAIWNRADMQHPAMGYTSTAWMAINSLTALFTRDKDTIVQFSKVYAFIAALGLLALATRWIIRLGYAIGPGLALVFLFFWNPVVGLHINSGMETILFLSLVFGFAYLVMNRANYFAILAVGFLCYLTRPEGGLLLATYWLWDVVGTRSFRRSAAGAAMLAALLTLYHAAVWTYYGDPLPLPFYIKQAMGPLFKPAAVKDTAVFLVACALPYLAVVVMGQRFDWSRLELVAVVQVQLVIFFLTVEPYMNVVYRYQMPVLALLFLTLISVRPRLAASKLLAAFLVLVVAAQWVFNLGVTDMYARKTGRAAENLKVIGRALQERNDYRAWMAYGDAGFVCYYSDFNTVDLNGLNTREIAKGSLSVEAALKNPDIRLLLANAEFKLDDPVVPRWPHDAAGLAYVGSVPVSRDSRRMAVVQFYARDDFMRAEELARIDTAPDYDPSWFEGLYYWGRNLIKSR